MIFRKSLSGIQDANHWRHTRPGPPWSQKMKRSAIHFQNGQIEGWWGLKKNVNRASQREGSRNTYFPPEAAIKAKKFYSGLAGKHWGALMWNVKRRRRAGVRKREREKEWAMQMKGLFSPQEGGDSSNRVSWVTVVWIRPQPWDTVGHRSYQGKWLATYWRTKPSCLNLHIC